MAFKITKRITLRIKLAVSRAALKWVEANDRSFLGRLRRWAIRRSPSIEALTNALRVVAANQLRSEEDSYLQSRIPADIEIKFLGFCLFEVFTIEDFKQFEHSLRFFPIDSLLVSMFRKARSDLDDEIDFQRDQVPGGILVRDRSLLAPGALGSLLGNEGQIGHSLMPSRVIESLPHEVLFVRISPIKVLPSLIAITSTVYLTADATQELLHLQQVKYRPQVVLSGFNERNILGSVPTKFDSDVLRKKAIQAWKTNLRRQIETSISPFLSGYFSTLPESKGRKRLPLIDVYSIKGAPKIPDGMEDWKSFYDWALEISSWAESIGIDLIGGSTYLSDLAHFAWGDDAGGSKRPLSQLVLWEETCQQKIKAEADNTVLSSHRSYLSVPGSDDLMEYAANMLSTMISGIAVLRVLQGLQSSIERLRLVAFTGLSKKLRLRAGYSLIDKVTREAMLLDRLDVEIRRDNLWPLGFFNFIIFDVKRLRRPGMHGEESFTEGTDGDIAQKIDLLKTNSAQVQKWLSERLSLRNTVAIYWLTVMAVLATLLSLISGWESLIKLISKVIASIIALIS